jgi:hypothetical protein
MIREYFEHTPFKKLENLGKNECVRYIRPTNIEIR